MSLLRLIHRYWPSNKYLDQYSIAAIHTPPRPVSFLSPTYPSSTQRHIPRKCECLPSTPLILSLSLALPPDPPQSYIHFVSHYRQAAGRCSDSATTPFWELVPVANASGQDKDPVVLLETLKKKGVLQPPAFGHSPRPGPKPPALTRDKRGRPRAEDVVLGRSGLGVLHLVQQLTDLR